MVTTRGDGRGEELAAVQSGQPPFREKWTFEERRVDPPGTIRWPFHEAVGGFDIRHFHGLGVPLDGLAGAQGEVAQRDKFGERRGVVEVRTRRATVGDAQRPLPLRILGHGAARFRLLDLARLHVAFHVSEAFLGKDHRVGAISIGLENDAVRADEHHPATRFVEDFLGDARDCAPGLIRRHRRASHHRPALTLRSTPDVCPSRRNDKPTASKAGRSTR